MREGMPPSLHFRTAPGRCVSLHNPASHGKHACGHVCDRACGRVCVLLLALEGLRRARAVLRASRVMREAVHARVR